MPKRKSQRSCLKLLPLIRWSGWSSEFPEPSLLSKNYKMLGWFPAEPPHIFHAFFSVSGASCFASIISALTTNPGQIWRASAKALWMINGCGIVFFFVSHLGTCKPKDQGTNKKSVSKNIPHFMCRSSKLQGLLIINQMLKWHAQLPGCIQ